VAFKKVLQDHEDLTKSFLNATLRLQGEKSISIVEYLTTERLPMTSESQKSILGVLCTDDRGLQYIIEVQMQNYLQRAQLHLLLGL
jgi:predicted transposase/invertase (TIGR01784 family)